MDERLERLADSEGPAAEAPRTRIPKKMYLLAVVVGLLIAGAAWWVFFRKPAPKPLRIVSEKTLFTDASSIFTSSGAASLSPSGKHLLYLKVSASYMLHPLLMDFDTGKSVDIGLPDKENHPLIARGWMDNIFSAKGNYIHAWAEDGVLLVYDLREGKLNKFDVGTYYGAIGDDQETAVFLTVSDDTSSEGGYMVARVPFTGGKVRGTAIQGSVHSLCDRQRLAILQGEGFVQRRPEISIVNFANSATMKTFRLSGEDGLYPCSFWTPDGRYFCLNDGRIVLPQSQGWFFGLFGSRSPGPVSAAQFCRIWDSQKDRLTSLRGKRAIALGPAPSALLVADVDEMGEIWTNLGVLDMSTGREWTVPGHAGDRLVCAYGRQALFAVQRDGGTALVLVEFALP